MARFHHIEESSWCRVEHETRASGEHLVYLLTSTPVSNFKYVHVHTGHVSKRG